MTRKRRYKWVSHYFDRHGKMRWRFRRAGFPTHNFKAAFGTKEFEAEYKACQECAPAAVTEQRLIPRSISELVSLYYKSAAFTGGDEEKKRCRGIIESFRAKYGDHLVADWEVQHIEAALLERKEKRVNEHGRIVGGEVAATKLRAQLRRLFAYAKRLKWIANNPVDDALPVGKKKLSGFHSWTEDEIAQYQARWPLGTKARLALEIILWTGQRRGDARLFGKQHIVRGKINFKASKNAADLWLPIAPDLKRAIEAMPSVGLHTFLVTDYGKPFTRDGFGNKMREWCDAAGLPQCAAHGLRKAIGRRMAESLVTQQGIKAVGGWKDDKTAAAYVAAANQEVLADDAIGRVAAKFSGGQE